MSWGIQLLCSRHPEEVIVAVRSTNKHNTDVRTDRSSINADDSPLLSDMLSEERCKDVLLQINIFDMLVSCSFFR